MWKKSDSDPLPQQPAPRPVSNQPEPRREVATIGPSISISGNLTGEEDLLIQGKIEGKIIFKKHNVTVGKNGRVKADIHGKSIRIEGEVRGNLFGEEDVVIRASGRVQGNLTAPRVTLENGSKFKGSIDMDSATRERSGPAGKPEAQATGKKEQAKPENPKSGELPGRPEGAPAQS